MRHLLENEWLSADDVLLVPEYGVLRSSSEAKLKPFIYSAPMDRVTGYALTKAMVAAGEYAVVSRNLPEAEYQKTLEEFAGNDQVFFAISIKREWLIQFLSRLEMLNLETTINLAIDVAHGDSADALACIEYLRRQGFVDKIMSGSIATPGGASRAVAAGATHLRVGIGPGSQCLTRVITGFGMPQLSAVYLIRKFLDTTSNTSITLIADGGIRSPGDAVKYLCAGADAIMMGSEFSKAWESPGWEFAGYEKIDLNEPIQFPIPDPEPVFSKNFRGCASAEHQREHLGSARAAPEGASSSTFYYEGETVESIVSKYRQGVQRAISYAGKTSIEELDSSVQMIKITQATIREGADHGNL